MQTKPIHPIRNFLHINLAGGAHSGKTTTFDYIKENLPEAFKNFDGKITFFFNEEEAQKLIRLHLGLDDLSFQLRVLSEQMAKFQKAKAYAELHPDEIVIVCSDRSFVDSAVYVDSPEIEAIGLTYLEKLTDHYFFFDFHPSFVTENLNANDTPRKEHSVLELSNLAAKTKTVYTNPQLIDQNKITFIPVFDCLEDKIAFAAKAIEDIVISYTKNMVATTGK